MRRFLARLFRTAKPELVPYYDFITRSTTLIPKAELSPGVVLIQIHGQPSPVYADAQQLKLGQYQHAPFEGHEREAIQSLVEDLGDVYPQTFDQWEDGFRRDRNPTNEIAGWMHLAAVLRTQTEKFAFTPAQRYECFRVLVACITGERESVRARSDPKLLSEDQFAQALTYFYDGGY